MAVPKVTWYSVDNINPISNWDIGTVDAGTVSPSTTFLIWNNRGGTTPVADMTNCTISTKDAAGGNTGELVTNKWIEVKVETLNENTYTAIGGTVTKTIQAGGNAGAGTISGIVNDGSLTGAALDCFAKVTLQANVPAIATAGNVDFLTRIAYMHQ